MLNKSPRNNAAGEDLVSLMGQTSVSVLDK